MPKLIYVPRDFSPASLELIAQVNRIVAEYGKQGFILTLRQLYYQFVARDLLANTVKNYKRLGSVVNDARLAGLVDWDAIEDRTRGLESLPHWKDPAEIVDTCASQFRLDKWATQDYRLEVWIEKEALAGVFAGICKKLDVPFLSCRGYTSQSEMWRGARRLLAFHKAARRQYVVVLHFGDHDPSGIDMSRDIEDRMKVFNCPINFVRLALNKDQVDQYDPPPNPAKETDSRFESYRKQHGDESWELDALEPRVLVALVEDNVKKFRDVARWNKAVELENEYKAELRTVARKWSSAVDAAEIDAESEEE